MVEAKPRTVRQILEELKAQTADKPEGTKIETNPVVNATLPDSKTYPALPVAELPLIPSFPGKSNQPLLLVGNIPEPNNSPLTVTPHTHRPTSLHANLYTDRDTKFLQFARDAQHRWNTLQTYISDEKAEHERWLAEWEKSVEGVKGIRSKMAGAA